MMQHNLDTMNKYEAKIATVDEIIAGTISDFGEETWCNEAEAAARLRRRRKAGKRARDDNVEEPQDDVEDDEDDDADDDDDADAKAAAGGDDDDDEEREMIDLSTFTTRRPKEYILEQYADFENTKFMMEEYKREATRLRAKVDMQVVRHWKDKDSAYKAQKLAYDDLIVRVTAADKKSAELRESRKTKFMETFAVIQRELKKMYQLLANGGDAEIELLDSSDPFEGINFVVRPPRKSWKQISNLSGGEKTLSSLALVFALHAVKSCPVYVMDEIDAALDFRNVSIVARYVLEQSIGAQFIIISLRNNMFELAHQLIGICKVRDCTNSIVMNPTSIQRHITAGVNERARRARAEGVVRGSQGQRASAATVPGERKSQRIEEVATA
jgi:structural maintenance of chromosome 4